VVKILVRFAFALLIAVLSVSVQSAGRDIPFDLAPLMSELQRALDESREELGFPGATAAVSLADGRLIKLASGFADLDRGIAITPDHRMPGGSTGKSWAAALAVLLADEGYWSLDDQAAQYLGDKPYWPGIANGDRITLKQLLRHSSGLQNYYDQPAFHRIVSQLHKGSGNIGALSRDALIRFIDGAPALFKPGTGYRYTDLGYLLVGEAIEAVTGRDYFSVLEEKVLEPLGLLLTGPTAPLIAGIAQGHIAIPGPLLPGVTRTVNAQGRLAFDPRLEFTGGGLATNPGDMARWLRALYRGDVVSGEGAEALLEAPPYHSVGDDMKGNYYGLGVFVKAHPSGGQSWGHGGYLMGYRSEMQYLPEHDVAVAVQVNTTDGFWQAPAEPDGDWSIVDNTAAPKLRLRLQEVVVHFLKELPDNSTIRPGGR
jgi:D-alanyl-D-alanine carboxypeptidase